MNEMQSSMSDRSSRYFWIDLYRGQLEDPPIKSIFGVLEIKLLKP